VGWNGVESGAKGAASGAKGAASGVIRSAEAAKKPLAPATGTK